MGRLGDTVTTCCSAFLGNNHFSSQNPGCLSQLHSLNHSCYHGRDTPEPRAGLDLHPPRQGHAARSPHGSILPPSISEVHLLSLALCSHFGQILVEFMVVNVQIFHFAARDFYKITGVFRLFHRECCLNQGGHAILSLY